MSNSQAVVGYALVDHQLILLENNHAFSQWQSLEVESNDLGGKLLTDIFPILIGYEEWLQALIAKETTTPLVISKIHHENQQHETCYFNLQIESCHLTNLAALRVIIVDVTVSTLLEQELQQEKNELRLQIIEREKIEAALRVELEAHQQTELALQKMKEAAEAANHAKSIFIAQMSHELRTPLNAILGYTQIFKRDQTLTVEQQKGIAIIHRSGEYLLKLINDILDLSKIETDHLNLQTYLFDFKKFVTELVELFKMRAQEKKLVFHYQPLTKLPQFVEADETRLRQIIINLLHNAIKFTPQGGVTLTVSSIESSENHIVHSDLLSQSQKNTIRFEITDTGIGIAPDAFSSIFLPFQQAGTSSYQAQGTGLGLAISQKLANLMGSELHVNSVLNQGSTFWFELTLPVITEPSTLTDDAKKPHIIGFEGAKRSILIVDDKWENRAVLKNLLLPLGFTVIEANNGQECLEKISQQPIDLVMMDLIMPVMDGLTATHHIRKMLHLTDIIIVAISASVFHAYLQEAKQAGCDDFISKPIEVDHVFNCLQKHLKLTWKYDSAIPIYSTIQPKEEHTIQTTVTESKLSTAQAEKLLELSMMGDVLGIQAFAQQLEQQPELVPIAKQIYRLLKPFQQKQLRQLAKLLC
jgi:signal transduction histidine kinase/DNA-binding response OmpR family regulator